MQSENALNYMSPSSLPCSDNPIGYKKQVMKFTGTMFYDNEIIKSLTTVDQTEHTSMILKALRRVVFERDPQKRLKLYLLDYNTSEVYYGNLNITEGLSKFEFKGKQVCLGHYSRSGHTDANRAFSQHFEEYFRVNQVSGIIFGPHSVSFKQYMKLTLFNEEVQNKKYDQWRFISIMTPLKSFDFILEDIDDALDLIITISEAISSTCDYELDKITTNIEAIIAQKENDGKFKQIQSLQRKKAAITEWYYMMKDMMRRYTMRRIMRVSFIRAKVVMMAQNEGYTMPQFLFLAIF